MHIISIKCFRYAPSYDAAVGSDNHQGSFILVDPCYVYPLQQTRAISKEPSLTGHQRPLVQNSENDH